MIIQFADYDGKIISSVELTLNELTPKDKMMAVERSLYDKLFSDLTPDSVQSLFILEPDGSITLLYPPKRVWRREDGKWNPERIFQIRADGYILWEADESSTDSDEEGADEYDGLPC